MIITRPNRRTMSYGGVDLGQLVMVSKVERRVLPKVRISETEVPGMDGELARQDGLEPYELAVDCYLRARDVYGVTEARRLLAEALLSDGPKPLYLPDDKLTYVMALYEGGAQLGSNSKRPQVELSFLVADPVAYGVRRSASLSTKASLVIPGGTYKTEPVVTAKPAEGSSWKVTNSSTGEFVLVYADFTGSQTVVVDMGLQRATINGSDHAVDITSDFFTLDGPQELSVSSGTATMEWQERWL